MRLMTRTIVHNFIKSAHYLKYSRNSEQIKVAWWTMFPIHMRMTVFTLPLSRLLFSHPTVVTLSQCLWLSSLSFSRSLSFQPTLCHPELVWPGGHLQTAFVSLCVSLLLCFFTRFSSWILAQGHSPLLPSKYRYQQRKTAELGLLAGKPQSISLSSGC